MFLWETCLRREVPDGNFLQKGLCLYKSLSGETLTTVRVLQKDVSLEKHVSGEKFLWELPSTVT
jgi:hypothetical protein